MTAAIFDSLCGALCELAACDMPPVAANPAGARAVSLMLDGVELTLGHDPQRGAAHLFVLVRFGQLPQGRELPACLALLQANSHMLAAQGPGFGQDPVTGDILLQQGYAFGDITPQDLYQAIVRLGGIAREWRATHFLG